MQKVKSKTAAVISKDLLFFVIGSMFYAISVSCFTAPNHIAPGGITGLSTALNYLFDYPIGVLFFVLNIPVFIWGICEIGYKLVAKTIVATLLGSVAIEIIAGLLPVYSGNFLLAAIFGGLFEGAGLSLIFMRGGTTGGTDMVARLLGRRYRHLSMGRLMLMVDVFVIAFSSIVFQSIESAMYSVITLFVSTKLIDTILYGTDSGTGKMLFIISEKSAEIAQEILTTMDRGVTALKSRGGYSGKEGEMLLCAVRREEVYLVTDIARSMDENAFIIVGDAGEITGEGFREVKKEDKTLKELIVGAKRPK